MEDKIKEGVTLIGAALVSVIIIGMIFSATATVGETTGVGEELYINISSMEVQLSQDNLVPDTLVITCVNDLGVMTEGSDYTADDATGLVTLIDEAGVVINDDIAIAAQGTAVTFSDELLPITGISFIICNESDDCFVPEGNYSLVSTYTAINATEGGLLVAGDYYANYTYDRWFDGDETCNAQYEFYINDATPTGIDNITKLIPIVGAIMLLGALAYAAYSLRL